MNQSVINFLKKYPYCFEAISKRYKSHGRMIKVDDMIRSGVLMYRICFSHNDEYIEYTIYTTDKYLQEHEDDLEEINNE